LISYVDSEFVVAAGTGADVTIASPAGTQPGDVLLLAIAQNVDPAGLNVGDLGWKFLIFAPLSGAAAFFLYRFAAADDPPVWTVTGMPSSGQIQVLLTAYHTDNPRGLVVDAWQQGWFSNAPSTAWTAYASTTRHDTVIAVAASVPTEPATMLAPTGFTIRHSEGTFVVADKDEATVGQFQYPGTLTAAAQWTSAALSVHERDPAPGNDNVLTPIDLNLAGQVRTIRRINATTNGATGTPSFPGTGGVTNSVWFRIVVPPNTTGPMRFAIPSRPGEEDFVQHRLALYHSLNLWRLNGADPSNPVDMQSLDDSYNRGNPEGLHNNCEGYAQGRDNYIVEWAAGGGEVYYLQVATYGFGSIDDDFTLEWTYDPLPEPTELTGPKTPSNCPGTPLTTHGWAIAYFDAISGFPARFSPGRSIPHAPAMPAVGHAFYVEDVREFDNVHIRRLIVGWTEATGPFLYGYLDHHGFARTWTADNEDPTGVGAASLLADGSVHQGIIFYDNPTHAAAQSTIRTIAGLGDRDPSYDWALSLGGTADMAWGGPGRPGSFFTNDFTTVTELDLNGNALGSWPGQPLATDSGDAFLWCGLAGTKLYVTRRSTLDFGWYLYSLNLATGTVTREQQILSGTVVGIRSSNGHIVTVASEVELYDPAVTSPSGPPATTGEFAFPLVSSVSTWASTFGRHWNPLGVTADGKHLFFTLFYPLTYPVPGSFSGGREFVSDVWWMDLDTGVCEHKFFLSHPFHDTFMVPDTVPAPPSTNVRNVRLYRQADVGR
jgi:hypothetical protein